LEPSAHRSRGAGKIVFTHGHTDEAARVAEWLTMAESMTLSAEPRTGQGSRDALRLRKKGLVPAVIYGHKQDAVHVTVPLDQLEAIVRHHGHTVELQDKSNVKQTVLIQEIQHCHLGKEILHVDFRRVDRDEMITLVVPVELRGIAPGTSTGVLDQPLHTLHVRCPALQVPESIRVNIEKLMLGQSIHVRELVLPANVTVVDDKDLVVVQVKSRSAEVPVTGLPGEGATEPEVITAKKKVEDADE
jgi:large subunit ribosomal protein L25